MTLQPSASCIDTKPAPDFEYCFGRRPVQELYDLLSDPSQVKKVAADPAFRTVKQQLAAEVDGFMKDSADLRALGPTSFWDQIPYTGPKFKAAP